MVDFISFKNYKAFKSWKLNLKPITILLWANSVWKSSILQLILLLKQTLVNDKIYNSALKLNGESIKLWENKNIFHNHDMDKPLELKFSTDSIHFDSLKFEFEEFIHDLWNWLQRTYYHLLWEEEKNLDDESTRWSDIDWSLEKIKKVKFKINKLLKWKKIIEEDDKYSKVGEFITSLIYFYYYRFWLSLADIYSIKEKRIIVNINELKNTYSFLWLITKNIEKEVKSSLHYEITGNNNVLKISKFELRLNQERILWVTWKSRNGCLYSDCFDSIPQSYLNEFYKNFNFSKLFFTSEKYLNSSMLKSTNIQWRNIFLLIVCKILKNATRKGSWGFGKEKINHVSPLRAYPKRYYFLDKANISTELNTVDWDQLTEILKENKSIKLIVNKWLQKFWLKVNVEKLADVIHNLKILQSWLELDITDVWFWLSQVLPVIVQGFLSKNDSLTIIEQPEIHLHPRMQAELWDLFIDMVLDENMKPKWKKILIETHSEYFLKRLRRRISEKKIKSSDVALYFIEWKRSKDKFSTIKEIPISETWNFTRPKEFYIDDLEDTIEFLKHQ